MIRFHVVPSFIKKLFPTFHWNFSRAEKVLYLTFDDGPIPELTDFVLDTLFIYQANATFFCVGENIKKNPEIFHRILENKHVIGNHTYNHLKGWKVSNDVYLKNVEQCDQIIAENVANSEKNKLFRPPYGRIKRSQTKMIKQTHRIILWDVLTCDYDRTLSSEKCLSNSIKATRNGSIIVFHDNIKAEKNLRYVLPRYLKHFADLGYRFDAIKL